MTIFLPSIKAGVGVAAFFCFMFSWVELLLAKTLTAVAAKPIAATMTKTASSAGYELGLLAAAGTLTIIPGAIVIYFVRNYIAKGFALGEGIMLSWMAWTWPTALVFVGIFSAIAVLVVIEIRSPGGAERRGILGLTTTRGDRLFIALLGSVYIFLAWLGLMGMPLWSPLALSLLWAVFCFRKV